MLLLVEVAGTSLIKDRAAKLPLSAKAGVEEVWLQGSPLPLAHGSIRESGEFVDLSQTAGDQR